MKLTEKDLRYVITEATKRIVNEHINPFGYNEYEGEDMSYESVYDNAEHALVTGMSMGKHYSSVNELIDELYDSSSFNETDYETVYDACEQAMMDVYEDNVNEGITKLTDSDLNYTIMEAAQRIVEWQRSGSIPRDGMTGGSWGSDDVNGVYWVDVNNLIELVDEETYSDELYDKLESIGEELYFNVSGTYGYDDSVGIPEGYDNIYVDYTPAMSAIKNLSLFRGDEIRELKNAIMQIADKVENDNGEGVDWN